jgi:3-hydroxyacyl-[acyl-carrier-protein] dehydratase
LQRSEKESPRCEMRWIWIDKFIEFESGKRAVALKNVTLAEEHLHDHFPGFPVMPESLCIEAMAQTAGILVGEAKRFQEKVILAKIKKAVFVNYVKPGDTIELEAKIESIVPEAAGTSGRITRSGKLIAEIDLMFSHIDRNLAGKEFPAENFVFGADTSVFKSLLRDALASAGKESERD